MASNKEVKRPIAHDNEEKQGVISSMMKAVQGTFENAREAVVGKRDDDHAAAAPNSHTTTEVVDVTGDDGVSGEVRDISANKSRGVYDSATDKAKETMECAGEKAKEAKDRTMDKAGEYKDYAAEKAKEGKDATMNKIGEYKDYTAEKAKEGKDSATDSAKRAMGYLGDKKEETKQKAAETTQAAKQKAAEAKDTTKEMMKGFEVENWRRGNEGVINIAEDTPTGKVAETLKAADQMTGQTFNDVGPMDDEERVARVGLLDIKKNDT